MDGVYYFATKEENDIWPDENNNTIYKVFSYSSRENKITTVARGETPEKAGEELFQNIYHRKFSEGKITQGFMKNSSEIKQIINKEIGNNKSLDDLTLTPLNNKEFEEFEKVREKYSYNK